jgi:hypothetical protein
MRLYSENSGDEDISHLDLRMQNEENLNTTEQNEEM